ncbi:DUF262 domain-containing protein [Weeksellaceae bacterium TAE3-ERU29]|nr:DUF262 domain-containing protein [Weeksellaceae bacterium TAE3-ERU29]
MKNVEKADRIHLGSLIDSLEKGQYVIPDFQRDFEWEPWDVLELIRSIFMDYYIGTLLLWKGNKENFDVLSCEAIYGFNSNLDPQHIVLDGQQRLTAIHYAFFAPNEPFPKRSKPVIYLINIRDLLEEDYENFIYYDYLTNKNKVFLENKNLQFENHIFPLGEMKGGTWGTSDWIKEYRDYWQDKADEAESEKEKKEFLKYVEGARVFRDIIKELLNDFYISYIELDHQIEVAKVCDIFTKINSKGVRLDIFDLLNAILRPKEIFLKQMWRDAEELLSFTDTKKMKIYVLQVMSVLEQSYCSSKYLYYLVPNSQKTIRKADGSKEQITLIENTEKFNERWYQSVKALKNAIESLKNPRDFGAVKATFVPYPSIIPAFAAIKEYVNETKPNNILDINKKIRKWYWASIFTNRYSSSVESTTAKDFMSLKKWFKDENETPEVIEEFINNFKHLDLKNDNPKGSAIYNAIFNLLVINEARDWNNFELPEYNELDDHHIVPYSIFKDEGGKAINSILNRTPISDVTNRHIINNRMPSDYIQEMFNNNDKNEVYKVFESHLISRHAIDILLRKPFTKTDFDEFLEERKRTILEAIQTQLINDKISIPIHLKHLNEEIEEIELAIREKIVSIIGKDMENYKLYIPQHIQDKVNRRIESDIKKKATAKIEDYNNFNKRIEFFDLTEYLDVITSKNNWDKFSNLFKDKNNLNHRFDQLRTLRNGIRHSRSISEIEQMDGEVAIKWFKSIL